MSGEYRQKLLNWFCSATLVLAFSAISPLLYWFINIPEWMELSPSREFSEVAWFFGEAFLVYALVLPVVLFWHCWDFVQKGVPARRWMRVCSAYLTFLTLVVATMFLWLLMASGFFTINSCDALDGALFHQCVIYQPYWLMFPWLAVACLALILSVAKGVISTRSQFRRAT